MQLSVLPLCIFTSKRKRAKSVLVARIVVLVALKINEIAIRKINKIKLLCFTGQFFVEKIGKV